MKRNFKTKINKKLNSFCALSDIYTDIKSQKYREKIDQIRSLEDYEERKTLKNSLPVYYPCISFDGVSASIEKCKEVESTGVVQFDIDNIKGDEAEQFKQELIEKVQELIYAFISPSGGLKFGIKTDFISSEKNVNDVFRFVYDAIETRLQKKFPEMKADRQCRSIVLPFFLSSDPDAYLNEKCETLQVKEEAEGQQRHEDREKKAKAYDAKTLTCSNDTVLSALAAIPSALQYDERYKVNVAVINAIGASKAIPALVNHWQHRKGRDHIAKQVKEQARTASKYPYSLEYLLKIANQHGFQSRHGGNRRKIADTDSEGTYRGKKNYSIAEGQKVLEEKLAHFFNDKKNQALMIEAGFGKTTSVLKHIVERGATKSNIAYFVPERKLGTDLTENIRGFIKGKKFKGFNKVLFRQINGFESSCYRNLNRGEELKFYTKKRCGNCTYGPTFGDPVCEYIKQYDNRFSGVRFYAHAHLFTPSNLDYEWKPDYLVIDEDILNSMIDESYVKECGFTDDLLVKVSECLDQDMSIEDALVHHYDSIREELKKTAKELKNPSITENRQAGLLKYQTDLESLLNPYGKFVDIVPTSKDSNNVCFKIVRKREINERWQGVPILLLDASGRQEVIEKLFDSDFEFSEIAVDYQDNVEVVQIKDNWVSKNWVNDGDNRRKVDNLIDLYKDDDTAVISYKYLVEDKENAMWFGGLRGKDDFSEKSRLLVVGRQLIPSTALLERCHVIFGKDDSRTDNRVAVERIITMADGKNKSFEAMDYINREMRLLHEHINIAETYQAVHRLRLIRGEEKKQVILFTSEVLPITIDRLVDSGEIGFTDIRMAFLKTIKENGVVPVKDNKLIAQSSQLPISQVKDLKDREKTWLSDNIHFKIVSLTCKKGSGKKAKRDFYVWRNILKSEYIEILKELYGFKVYMD